MKEVNFTLSGHDIRSLANDNRKLGHKEHWRKFDSRGQAEMMDDTADLRLRDKQLKQYNKLRNDEKRFNLSDQDILDMTLDCEQKIRFNKTFKR